MNPLHKHITPGHVFPSAARAQDKIPVLDLLSGQYWFHILIITSFTSSLQEQNGAVLKS